MPIPFLPALVSVLMLVIAVPGGPFSPRLARADDTADPNALFSFKKIFPAPHQDNVDGAFDSVVGRDKDEFFSVNPRFQKAGDRAAADGILALKIEKKAESIELEARLLVGGTEEVFGWETLKVRGDIDDVMLRSKLVALIKALMGRIPFFGTVSGRDGDQVTLDIGSYQGVGEGDLVQIARIDAVKRHPLLKQVVDMQLVPVGSVRVTQVEEGLAFGRVEGEFPGETVRRLHKISGLERKSIDAAPVQGGKKGRSQGLFENEKHPQYGMVSLGVSLAGFSHGATRTGRSLAGGGFNPGFRLSGEIWLTSGFFAELTAGGSIMSYSQAAGSSAVAAGVPSTTRSFGINGGYRFLFGDSIYGPQLSARFGYLNYRWQVGTSAEDLLTARTYGGLNLGIGAALPFGKRPYGAQVNVGMMLFPSYSETSQVIGAKGDDSSTVAQFYLGGYYFFEPRLSVRAGIHFESYSTDISTFGASGSSSQKNIGFLPSVQYYF